MEWVKALTTGSRPLVLTTNKASKPNLIVSGLARTACHHPGVYLIVSAFLPPLYWQPARHPSRRSKLSLMGFAAWREHAACAAGSEN